MGDAYECDRCGALGAGQPAGRLHNWTVDEDNPHNGPSLYDDDSHVKELCPTCQRKHEDFMDGVYSG